MLKRRSEPFRPGAGVKMARYISTACILGSSEERGAFSRNATKTWVEGGDLPSVCRAAPLSSLVPYTVVVVDHFTPVYLFTPTLNFLKDLIINNSLFQSQLHHITKVDNFI